MWQLLLDVSQVISQIATTFIAGFVAWIAYKTFLRIPEQEQEKTTKLVAQEDIDDLDQIVVFQTLNQRTLLKATNKGVECQLFDARPGKASGLQWVVHKDDVGRILNAKDYHVVAGIKFKTGVFSIGEHRNWLYSKVLFPEPEILKSKITMLLEMF